MLKKVEKYNIAFKDGEIMDKKEFLNSLTDNNGLIKFFRSKVKSISSKFSYEIDDYSHYIDDDNFISLDKIGEIGFDNDESLIIIKSELENELTSKSSKKKQYEIAKKILKSETFDAVIFIIYDKNNNFRFSLITKNYIGVKSEFNSFKRYTYFIDINKPNKTFINQIEKADFSSIEMVKEAFSIEPLNKEFYQKIASSFYNLVGGKIKINKKTKEYNSVLQLPDFDINKNRKVYQEFAVRLIGRTIFIWFLKNKKSKNNLPLIPESWLTVDKVNEESSYYHNLLERLFFDILNKEAKNRSENLPKEHITIPFLNGGLFEPHNYDFYDTNQFNGKLNIPNNWFIELFTTLEQFNFTIDENSLSDQEVSIDPEMLGTIFENLLAEIDPDTEKSARKSTGSFYTPREIVDYMVEESLVAYLNNKTNIEENILHDLFKENDFTAQHFKEPRKLIDAFDELKILDPACGSGAFPMGALHKINIALQKLDPDAKIWKEKQLSKIDNMAFRQILKNKLDNSNVDYIRKLGIIQHSIYGVDIQTIATEISKLRSFLSLIVDEHIDDDAENRGILPLPNLEFKFVTANTLIGLEEKKKSGFDFGGVNNDIENLKKIRKEYLQSSGDDKISLKKEFLNIQNKIAQKEQGKGSSELNKRSFQISSWKPFSHESNDWFDSELMFGVKGFDVVVGNPPYIQLQKALPNSEILKYADLYKGKEEIVEKQSKNGKTQKKKVKIPSKYETFERTGDIYALFYENGIKNLRKDGVLCFITSNKWMRAKYGESLREFFIKYNPLVLLDMGPGIFNTATVDTNILLIKNNENESNLKALKFTKKYKINELMDNDFIKTKNLTKESWIILGKKELSIKKKIEEIGTPLKDWDINIYRGLLTGYNNAFIINTEIKNEILENCKTQKEREKTKKILKPILRGKDIKRYKAGWAELWLIYIPWHFPNHLKSKNSDFRYNEKCFEEEYPSVYYHLLNYKDFLLKRNKAETEIRYEWYAMQRWAAKYYSEFEKDKIIWKRIGSVIRFSYSVKKELCLDSTAISTGQNIKYLTLLLNSKLHLRELINNSPKTGTGDAIISVQALNPLYVYKPNTKEVKSFDIIFDVIMKKKENNEDTKKEELKIDIMVYKLYELTYDEVKVIDSDFGLSRVEYDEWKDI